MPVPRTLLIQLLGVEKAQKHLPALQPNVFVNREQVLDDLERVNQALFNEVSAELKSPQNDEVNEQ